MKVLSLRLQDEVYERLRQEAFDSRITITNIIRSALLDRSAATAASLLTAMKEETPLTPKKKQESPTWKPSKLCPHGRQWKTCFEPGCTTFARMHET